MFSGFNRKKISPQSKSFLILFSIAIIGSYACLVIADRNDFPSARTLFHRNQNSFESKIYDINKSTPYTHASADTAQPQVTVDTAKWKTYANTAFGISFLYPPQWKVKKPAIKYGVNAVVIDPGAQYDNITIYISNTGFFSLDGLQSTAETIAGEQAKNIQGSLYGISHQGNYYTFDSGLSITVRPQFQALVHSIKFAN